MTRFLAAFTKPLPALTRFITAGGADTSVDLDALVEGGEDMIELGKAT